MPAQLPDCPLFNRGPAVAQRDATRIHRANPKHFTDDTVRHWASRRSHRPNHLHVRWRYLRRELFDLMPRCRRCPKDATQDRIDVAARRRERCGNLGARHACRRHLFHARHVRFGEARMVVSFTTRYSQFHHRVAGIVSWRAYKQMVWPDTSTVVTYVAHVHAWRDRSDVQFITDTVRAVTAIVPSCPSELAVSAAFDVSSPQPAAIFRLRNFAPETVRQ